jgi:hypothetical protein
MPTTAKGILAFLEFTRFYCKFIKNYSIIALLLTKAVKLTIKTHTTKFSCKVKKVVY